MSLSEGERQIIVRRELEKAQKTYEDMDFCVKEGKWEAAAKPSILCLVSCYVGITHQRWLCCKKP